jgi:pSer/pThr/pTyr-binding forkhead associated (FHA) protein
LLKSQGKDPLQVSRNQFTMFKESDSYYIEDGVTSVQDKPSGNHTTVNGKDITGQGKQELNDGDQIGIATILDATFRIN